MQDGKVRLGVSVGLAFFVCSLLGTFLWMIACLSSGCFCLSLRASEDGTELMTGMTVCSNDSRCTWGFPHEGGHLMNESFITRTPGKVGLRMSIVLLVHKGI